MIEPAFAGGAASAGASNAAGVGSGAPVTALRAGLRVGGAVLARYQLGLALSLGCERIICITERVDGELVALQHVAEEAGASLHRADGAGGLLGLVSAADEVIALVDGLLVWPDIALAQLGEGLVVLMQPIETGLAAGFERMDLNHAAAGAIRVPGRLIEQMASHPPDCDVFSTLQRLALQAGVPQRLLPPQAYEAGCWNLVRSEAEAQDVEPLWIRLLTASPGRATPSLVIARRAVRLLGPALLHAGSSGTVVAIGGGVACALGLVLGWFGHGGLGLGFCALGWVQFMAASLFGRVERRGLRLAAPSLAPMMVYGVVMDGVLGLMLVWDAALNIGPLWLRMFVAVMVLGRARLTVLVRPAAVWLEDRALMAIVLGLAAAVGRLGPGMALVALAMLIYGLLRAPRPSS